MTDLVAFVRARLDEDEAYARKEQGWNVYDPGEPARVLRVVEAMRAIVDMHKVNSEPEIQNIEHHDKKWNTGWTEHKTTGRTVYWCDECDHDRDYGHISSPQEGCPTLRHLASIWRDHADYDPGWGP